MEKKISYLNRNFYDYRNSLLDYTKQYYPELEDDFNDASIGSWILDIVSNIGDNLSYHIDRVYQETSIDSAQEKASIYALARNNGVKIPGPKASVAEVEFTCELPVYNNNARASEMSVPDYSFAPLIKKGTKVSAGDQVFELMENVDFNEQFNENGVSNRTITPNRDSNGYITKYTLKKTGIVSSGETKIYTRVINSNDITPFMNFIVPDTNILNIESIIFKDGTNHYGMPTLAEFQYLKEENVNKCEKDIPVWRFFEVDYLAQQYRWGDDENDGTPNVVKKDRIDSNTYDYSIRKGTWVPLRQKFVSEYTDKGYVKVTFGSGYDYVDFNEVNENETNISPKDYKHYISHLINNDGLGILPKANTTMYVLYRKGGGVMSNVSKGAMRNITYLDAEFRGEDKNKINDIKRSLTVTNTTPSVLGRDMPSVDEIRNLIKYNNGAQERCVTLKDYHDRISKMPPRYGCPFRYGVIEENNKIIVYTIGLDNNGNLSEALPEILRENIKNYLSEYRMINDFIEIKSGRIINLQFEIDIYVDKTYNTSNVLNDVINCVKNYMDINKLQMGDDIFVGDIEKEISKIDGVLNLIDLRVYNVFDNGYSKTRTQQQVKSIYDCYSDAEISENITEEENRSCIDLKASDKMLYTENDTMFEIKYPNKDIICRVKTR